MRIATWNVNSLRARLDKVVGWLATADTDVLLMQETKLTDLAAPDMAFGMAGYRLAHHGEGRWNGVAIASRVGLDAITSNFGDGPPQPASPGPSDDGASEARDDEPGAEARMIAATCGGIRVVSLYAPNGRALDTPFYAAKLAWYERLLAWLEASASPDEPLVLGGDLNIAPTDLDVYDPAAYVGTTHTSGRERAAFQALLSWGLVDAYRLHHPEGGRYTWWDYRAGNFHKGLGMRIDHLLVTRSLAARVTAAEVDRDARKGPTPSDHAPMWIDIADA